MSYEADRFRSRANQCRALALDARDPESRQTLNDMANELDAEADNIDSDESKPKDA